MNKPKLIISACLYGYPVRYDGLAKPLAASQLQKLAKHYELLPLCPECLGGLPIPRPAAEIVGGSGKEVLAGQACIKTVDGEDLSSAFIAGAGLVLQEALAQGAKLAILKAGSPSCGAHQHYDGTFRSKLRDGQGVTAALLQSHGIQVISEDDLHADRPYSGIESAGASTEN